jgi:hypothetical protein
MWRETDGELARAARAGAAIVLAAGLVAAVGCGGRGRGARATEPTVNVGLGQLLEESGPTAMAEGSAPGDEQPEAVPEQDFEAFVSDQVAALDLALGNATPTPAAELDAGEAEPAGEAAADVSLAQLLESGAEPAPQPASDDADGTATPAGSADEQPHAQEPQSPAARVDALYAELDKALGQELEATSEPFRTAVALIAVAAAQGRDPLEAIGPGTAAGGKLSPAERESAEAVAQLLGTLLSPGESAEGERGAVLQELAARLTQNVGLRIPRAELCTRVRGFGKYEPFGKTDFLAGRPVRALVYAELDGFEHRPVDTERLGGLVPEDQWSVEVSEELQLYHVADGRLAWRRPAEKVVETSRNRQRDFYLLAEIQLPPTLTVGSYELKVIIRDDVSGAVAEKVIPIGVVADPELAWTPR